MRFRDVFFPPKPTEEVLHPEVEQITCHVMRLGSGVAIRIEGQSAAVTAMLPRQQAVLLVDTILDLLGFETEESA